MTTMRTVAAGAVLAVLTTLLTVLGAVPGMAQVAGSAAVGPIDPETGFPVSYTDTAGTALELCLTGDPNDPAALCLFPPPDPAQPPRVPGNFQDEAFWWSAEAQLPVGGGTARLVLAQEAAFANGPVVPGDQVAFARIRIRVPNLIAGATYQVTHPFGTDTFVATPVAGTVGEINSTVDTGCGVQVPCDFTRALPSATRVSTFLRWDPAVAPAAPAGYLGDPTVAHPVVGSPTGTNLFRVSGPGLPGGAVTTNLFAVQGRLATPRTGPDLVLDSTTSTIDFGRAVLDDPAGVTRTVTLRSDGDADLTFGTVTVDPATPDYTVTGSTCGGVLAPGTACTVDVRFAPASATPGAPTPADEGLRRADLVVASDDASAGGSSRIGLSGTASHLDAAALAARVGPIDEQHGFPVTYTDDAAFVLGGSATDTRLELCLAGDPADPAALCLMPPPDPAVDSAVPGNFAEEGFWWSAEAAIDDGTGRRADLVMALEAAFLNGGPVAGDGQSFGRIRFRIDELTPDADYTVTFPYGTRTLRSDADGVIFVTEDVGCMDLPSAAPTPGFGGRNRCDVTAALDSPVTRSFLRWDPAVAPAAPEGYLGDPDVAHRVVGSPTGVHEFRVAGPGLPEGGIATDLFAVSGKLAAPLVPRPDDRFTFAAAGSDTVTVVNDSPAPVSITEAVLGGPAAADFALAAPVDPAPIAPGAGREVSATFTPTAAGLRAATLTLRTDTGAPLVVGLAGRGPAVTVAPTALTFPATTIGATSPAQTVTVTNTSAAPVTVTTAVPGPEFTATGCTAPIAAGGTCAVAVRFAPTAAGPRTATLTVTAPGQPPLEVALTGTGVAPALVLTPAGLAFGNQGIGTTSAPQAIAVRNTGATPVTVTGVTTGSAEFLTADTCPSIAPGATCSLSVTFRPAIAGPRTATLTIASDAAGAPTTAALSGTGVVIDTVPPGVVAGSTTGNRFSPNGDGRQDQLSVLANFSEPVTWTFDVRDSRNTVVFTGTGSRASAGSSTITWGGQLTAGGTARDGTYTWRLVARDLAGNQAAPVQAPVTVDTRPAGVSGPSFNRSNFRPAQGQTVTIGVGVDEGAVVAVEIRDGAGALVRTLGPTTRTTAGNVAFNWDGRDSGGAIVPAGSYRVSTVVTDLAGNVSPSRTGTVTVRA